MLVRWHIQVGQGQVLFSYKIESEKQKRLAFEE